MHIDPYNCRYESKSKIFMGPEGCNFLKIKISLQRYLWWLEQLLCPSEGLCCA